MSTELESLIRPFQNNDITPSRTYYMPGEVGVPNIILRLGRGGGGKMLTGQYNYTQTFYCDQEQIMRDKEGRETSSGG